MMATLLPLATASLIQSATDFARECAVRQCRQGVVHGQVAVVG